MFTSCKSLSVWGFFSFFAYPHFQPCPTGRSTTSNNPNKKSHSLFFRKVRLFSFSQGANRAQPYYDRACSLGSGMVSKGGRTMIRAAAAAAAAASLWGQLVTVSLSLSLRCRKYLLVYHNMMPFPSQRLPLRFGRDLVLTPGWPGPSPRNTLPFMGAQPRAVQQPQILCNTK